MAIVSCLAQFRGTEEVVRTLRRQLVEKEEKNEGNYSECEKINEQLREQLAAKDKEMADVKRTHQSCLVHLSSFQLYERSIAPLQNKDRAQ
ncbi:hypothetical protein scyTo_0001832 [Scyliorhinus torazame]|uniref:Uncharacterized protein n=1 Tax=Scyliorhinus torazame TaxID=75743 RepID=A0A401PG75_SCYTO|nr:hypothetical protein [Scyliorhinus torazame]